MVFSTKTCSLPKILVHRQLLDYILTCIEIPFFNASWLAPLDWKNIESPSVCTILHISMQIDI